MLYAGCSGQDNEIYIPERVDGEFRGFKVRVKPEQKDGQKGVVLFDDVGFKLKSGDRDGNGRFDFIALEFMGGSLPNEISPLEKYAQFDSLELAYRTVMGEIEPEDMNVILDRTLEQMGRSRSGRSKK